jgi:hypothetical protein
MADDKMSFSHLLQYQKGTEMSDTEQDNAAPSFEDVIRTRAYLMWEADGKPEGGADQYWHQARERIEAETHSAYPPAASAAHRS